MGTPHKIGEFLDDEDGINRRRKIQAGVIKEIAKCGKRMRENLDGIILVMAPIAILVIVSTILEYVLLIQYFGG